MACIFCKMPYVFFSDNRSASKKLILSPGNKDVVLENYAKQSPCKDAENELFRTFAQYIYKK